MLARGLLLIAVVIWGWTFVATKICLAYMTPVELMGLRLAVALPVMLLILVARGIRPRVTGHFGSLLFGSAVIGLHFYIQITGLQYTSATNTGWIIGVTPLVMALLAGLTLGERLHRGLLAGIGIATAGILLLVSRGDLGGLNWISSIGDWLVLGSAHTWAVYTVIIRNVSRSAHPLAVTFCVFLPPTLVTVGIVAVSSDWTRFVHLPLEPLLALVFLGIFGMAFAHWFWQVGVARLGAARAGVFLYIEPLATTALAVPYLGEPFGAAGIVGGGLVLFGVWVALRARRLRSRVGWYNRRPS